MGGEFDAACSVHHPLFDCSALTVLVYAAATCPVWLAHTQALWLMGAQLVQVETAVLVVHHSRCSCDLIEKFELTLSL